MRERATLVLSLVVLTGFAAGSYWLAERARLADIVDVHVEPGPDYFAERFIVTHMGKDGTPSYRLTAARMTHFFADDATTLDHPALQSLSTTQPAMTITADLGKLSSEGEQIDLSGNVDVQRAASADGGAMRLQTPRLLAYPEQDILRSSDGVILTQDGSIVTAQNMELDNGNRSIQLTKGASGQVHAVLQPRRAPGAKSGTRPDAQADTRSNQSATGPASAAAR